MNLLPNTMEGIEAWRLSATFVDVANYESITPDLNKLTFELSLKLWFETKCYVISRVIQEETHFPFAVL